MPVVDTTTPFSNNEQITSTKLNNIMDNSFFVSGAVVGNQGLEVTASGQMQIPNGGIKTALLETGAIDASKISTGGPSWTASSISLPNPTTITGNATVTGNATITGTTTSTGALTVGTAKMNVPSGSAPIFGARAWVSFDGTTAGTFAGGGSTVTRASGSTLCTVTTASPHGMVTNNRVYASTGVAVGTYTITRLTDTTFTFITAATTPLSSASITFLVRSINGSGNVNSVAFSGTGLYYVNLSTELSSSNYAVSWAGTSNGVSGATFASTLYVTDKNTSSFKAEFSGATAANNANQPVVDFVVFQ
jgi:filamentous hemagglutinin